MVVVFKFFFGVDELRVYVEVWYVVWLVIIFNDLLLGIDKIYCVGCLVLVKFYLCDMMRIVDDFEDIWSMNSGKWLCDLLGFLL